MLYFSRYEKVNGVACDVFATFPTGAKDTEKYFEVAVDPAHDCAVVKFSSFDARKPGYFYSYQYAVQSDLWLPTSWSVEVYSGGRLFSTIKSESVRVEPVADATDALFTMTFPNGLSVEKVIVPNTKGNHPTSKDIKTIPAVVVDGDIVDPNDPKWFSWKNRWLQITAGALLLAAIVFLTRRHLRRVNLIKGST